MSDHNLYVVCENFFGEDLFEIYMITSDESCAVDYCLDLQEIDKNGDPRFFIGTMEAGVKYDDKGWERVYYPHPPGDQDE